MYEGLVLIELHGTWFLEVAQHQLVIRNKVLVKKLDQSSGGKF